MAAACLGFLPFNFPKAKVFMGDVGSVLLGFVFAALVVSLFRDLLDFVCLASYLFPFYVDELTTMVVRLKDGENLLNAHRRHVYQLLANEGGIPHWKVSLFYGFIQVLVGATVLWMRTFGGLAIGFLLGGYSVLSVFACIWVRRRYEGKGQRGSVRIVDKGQEK
jgi:Fuc2NAc and GlcNAc transferase